MLFKIIPQVPYQGFLTHDNHQPNKWNVIKFLFVVELCYMKVQNALVWNQWTTGYPANNDIIFRVRASPSSSEGFAFLGMYAEIFHLYVLLYWS